MIPVMEAVPNFSEGRDLAKVRALVGTIERCDVEVLDWSADPDHNRSVVSFIGDPRAVEEASLAAARFAVDAFDLRAHEGVHPRVGALDVLPFVPLRALDMDDAVASARRVAGRLAALGLPVFLYGAASSPPGRRLADLRRGGVEALWAGFPGDRRPDFSPPGMSSPHPTAGVTCVGARSVLLAWNVFVEGLSIHDVREVAAALRERQGGFSGLRALGLHLERQDRMQISMNLEDPERTSPLRVLEAIESAVRERGGRVAGTEVIGMVPDALVLQAAADRLDLPDLVPSRILSQRVPSHVAHRVERDAGALARAVERAGPSIPKEVRELALRIIGQAASSKTPNEET